MKVTRDALLAPFTTFHIGGPAQALAEAESIDEIRQACTEAVREGLPLLVLGGGSNILADDTAMPAMFLRPRIRGIVQEGETLIVGAGERWDDVAAYAAAQGLWGLENLAGIPGEVGGACVQNIGAYGAALSSTVLWVEAYDTKRDECVRFTREQCAFGYRDSAFKRVKGQLIVTRAALELSLVSTPDLSYRDLAHAFPSGKAPLGAIRDAVLSIRAQKFPDLSFEGTAGSFFKNPMADAQEAKRLAARYPGLPLFPMPETSSLKVPLAWFLDYRNGVLDLRQLRHGGARPFERQPLVIAASHGATARDVRAVAADIAREVKRVVGIDIEPEACVVRNDCFTTDIFW